MKQMGLALHNYESTNACFPWGVQRSTPYDNCAAFPRFGMLIYLLPFAENTQLYNAINFFGGSAAAPVSAANSVRNYTGMATKVASYVCPSDLPQTPLDPSTFVGWTQSSYSGMAGTTELWRYSYNPPTNADICYRLDANGLFGLNRVRKISEITDGTSNTLAIGEYSRFVNEPSSVFNTWTQCAWWGDGIGSGSRPQCIAYSAVKLNAPASSASVNAAIDNLGPFDWFKDPVAQNYGQFGFRSMHPGGANFLMADGSVKFLKNSISLPTYRALSTFGQSEVVSADAY